MSFYIECSQDSDSTQFSNSSSGHFKEGFNEDLTSYSNSDSRTIRQSEVWKYFRRGGRMNYKRKFKSICKDCDKEIICYDSSTSLLWRHLMNYHPRKYGKTDKCNNENNTKPIEKYITGGGEEFSQQEFMKYLVIYIVNEQKPFTDIQSTPFKNLLSYLNPNVAFPIIIL